MLIRRLCFLLFISNLLATVVVAENLDRRAVMAEAMLNMMESFGFFGNKSDSRGGSPPAWNQMPQFPTTWNLPFNINGRLDGMWLGLSGERLQFQGGNFYLQAADGRQISGAVQVRERMLALHQPKFNLTMVYEYAIQDNKLALRDRQGNIMLYRRVQ